jgi:hypothetical protein
MKCRPINIDESIRELPGIDKLKKLTLFGNWVCGIVLGLLMRKSTNPTFELFENATMFSSCEIAICVI